MLRNVAVLALEGVEPFDLGVLCEVFGADRTDSGLPGYEFAVCGLAAGQVRTSVGMTLAVEAGLERLAVADLVAVSAATTDRQPPAAVITALQAAVARGARVLSVCSGAFTLAAAGLLDGRRATTHWMHAEELATSYPQVQVDPDVLYVDADPIFTSAGTAAGIDLCLHLLRREHGAAVANAVARRMVVPPHRAGGQAQYIEAPVSGVATGDDPIGALLSWLTAHMDQAHTVASLARRCHMSMRTFARRFRAATGTTPAAWLTRERIRHVQRLLETTDAPVEVIANQAGFDSPAAMRVHFIRTVGTSPRAYRSTFRERADLAG